MAKTEFKIEGLGTTVGAQSIPDANEGMFIQRNYLVLYIAGPTELFKTMGKDPEFDNRVRVECLKAAENVMVQLWEGKQGTKHKPSKRKIKLEVDDAAGDNGRLSSAEVG